MSKMKWNQAKYLTIVMLVVCNQIKLYNISMDEILQNLPVVWTAVLHDEIWIFQNKFFLMTGYHQIRSHQGSILFIPVKLGCIPSCYYSLSSYLFKFNSLFCCCWKILSLVIHKRYICVSFHSLLVYLYFLTQNRRFSELHYYPGSYVFETRAKSSLNNILCRNSLNFRGKSHISPILHCEVMMKRICLIFVCHIVRVRSGKLHSRELFSFLNGTLCSRIKSQN